MCCIMGESESAYFQPKCSADKGMCDVMLMNEIQDIYARRSFQEYKRITQDLKDMEYIVNHKRMYRLMRQMGLQTVYPKQNRSNRRLADAVHPYLLKQHPPHKVHDC